MRRARDADKKRVMTKKRAQGSWLLASPLPPPPPLVRSSRSKAFVAFGVVLLLVNIILLGLLLWELFTTTYWFSGHVKGDEIRITEAIFFEPQLRVEVSHLFVSGYSATIHVAIENASGLVWQHMFGLSSPGTKQETIYDSDYLTLMPGRYIVKVNSSVPVAVTLATGKTEVVVERSGYLTLSGKIFMFFLFPFSVVCGLIALIYQGKPEDFKLGHAAIVWIASILLIAVIMMFFRSILYILGILIALIVLGLFIQRLRRLLGR